MTIPALLAELRGIGVRLSIHGDSLRVEAKPGTLSAGLRARLASAKPELIASLKSDLRGRLQALAKCDEVPSALVDGLSTADLAACDNLEDDTLRAYLRALRRGSDMDADVVPKGYTLAGRCDGCGPVWLWPGSPARVVACPWCFRRKAGRDVPRPWESNHGNE